MILMGSDYWAGLVDWMKEKMLKQHNHIAPEDMDVFKVVDEPEAATKIIVDFKEAKGRVGIELPAGMRKLKA